MRFVCICIFVFYIFISYYTVRVLYYVLQSFTVLYSYCFNPKEYGYSVLRYLYSTYCTVKRSLVDIWHLSSVFFITCQQPITSFRSDNTAAQHAVLYCMIHSVNTPRTFHLQYLNLSCSTAQTLKRSNAQTLKRSSAQTPWLPP
jgi:hypothetical protein